SRSNAKFLRSEIIARLEIELIELRMLGGTPSSRSLGDGEDGEEYDRETHSGNRRDLFRHKVDDAQCDERERYQPQSKRNFHASDFEVERHPEFAFTSMVVTKHQDGQSLRCEAPHDAEGVCFAKEKDVASA